MLQNAYFLAKIGADTAENEQHFADILPKTGNYPTGPPGRARSVAAIAAYLSDPLVEDLDVRRSETHAGIPAPALKGCLWKVKVNVKNDH